MFKVVIKRIKQRLHKLLYCFYCWHSICTCLKEKTSVTRFTQRTFASLELQSFTKALETNFRNWVKWDLLGKLSRQLLHSLFCDSNIALFYFWWKETTIKRKKQSMYFVKCPKKKCTSKTLENQTFLVGIKMQYRYGRS